MANMRKMPVGIQDFQKLREEGFVYVDKTALIYDLVQNSCPYFFSRPRRFGKSLLVSTLEAYFTGRKELFEGLAISGLEKEWAEHPVLHFDFNGQNYSDPEGLNMMIDAHLRKWEERYGIEKKSPSPGLRLADIIDGACRQSGRKVVVLVDEYDKPLLETMVLSDEQIEANRAVFKGMFGQLKNLDGKLRFVLFTGVTKFSKVSIFSDLNQLRDISMDEAFASICGITQEELEKDFSPEIDAMAKENGMTREACIAKLKQFYDGYHFSKDSPDIYNPFSLLNAFSRKDFGKYWFGTGTPTFLVKRLNEMNFNPRSFSDGSLYSSEDAISDYRPDNPDIVPLLYQSGYLTIKAYDDRRRRITLGYPNDEVKYGFTASLAPVYLHNQNGRTGADIFAIDDAVEDGDTDLLKEQFTALFARLPYANGTADDAMLERDFQNVIYLTFLLLGQFVQVEQHTARGRADCIVETDRYVYIFEFKRDGSADEALAQIEAQGYAAPYAADSRTLVKIGAVFSSEQKNISEWKVLGK
ncbi:MAG: ATP-binding protein [Treponema sp.]|nr:ATP-binding protein [Treponema sp.]